MKCWVVILLACIVIGCRPLPTKKQIEPVTIEFVRSEFTRWKMSYTSDSEIEVAKKWEETAKNTYKEDVQYYILDDRYIAPKNFKKHSFLDGNFIYVKDLTYTPPLAKGKEW